MLARSDPAALSRFLERCQDWEARSDPPDSSFRAKRHDDKTIVSVLLP